MHMFVESSNAIKTYLLAATAVGIVMGIYRHSFPPNPPPSLFTRQTILFADTPSAFATNFCVERENSVV